MRDAARSARAAVSALAATAILLAAPARLAAQPRPDPPRLAEAIDAVMTAIYPPGQPGAAIVVVRDGRVVFRKAYGLSNLELGTPMVPESVLPIASLSKAFTATAILMLAERGQLSLQDDITRFLPQYPVRGARITIEHLLTHTSGLSSLTETSDLRASASPEGRLTDLIADWVRDLPPDAAPGERWAYSNWGYNLLAAIVEQASGTPYPQFVQTRILDPLGMTRTHYEDKRRVIPLRASGYDAAPEGPFNVLPSRSRSYQPGGAGSWLSTVDDLARWNAALDGTALVSRASLDRMFTAYRLKDGTSTRYGYAWDLGEYEGGRVQEHQGGLSGFLSHVVRMPDDRVLVVVLSNRYSMNPPLQATSHRVAALAAGKPIPEPRAIDAPPAALAPLEGTYRGMDVGTCTVVLKGGALAIQVPGFGSLPLIPTGGDVFRTPTLTWTFAFERGADDRGARVRVRDWKLDDLASRIEPTPPVPRPVIAVAARDLEACAGEYESLNGILVRVVRVGDRLSVRPFAQAAVEVRPVAPLEFETASGDLVYRFVRDARGEIAGFERSSGSTPVPARRLR
jgi:D-alanyl-D-alanine carboxypeptidase